jgi:hypothetical protein
VIQGRALLAPKYFWESMTKQRREKRSAGAA